MSVARIAIPASLLAAAVAWLAFSPGSDVPAPSKGESVASPTAAASGDLPDGVSGELEYRSGEDVVTVALADGGANKVGRRAAEIADAGVASADGRFRARTACTEGRCGVEIVGHDGATRSIDQQVARFEWSRDGSTLALLAFHGPVQTLSVIDEPVLGEPRIVAADATAFAWTSDGALLAAVRTSDGPLLQRMALDGAVTGSVALPDAARFFYPSSDAMRFAFTVQEARGWHMRMYDDATGAVSDFGNVGSDGADAIAVTGPPDVKAPMAVAWSPNGRYIAFGGGYEPPFIMTTIDVESGSAVATTFPTGYPGEIKWNADGSALAVSTYDVERTHHETWMIDPQTGTGRHLMNGCVIVWSPDGRFLAVHGEDVPGIAIVDVASGDRGQLTHDTNDVPLAWSD